MLALTVIDKSEVRADWRAQPAHGASPVIFVKDSGRMVGTSLAS